MKRVAVSVGHTKSNVLVLCKKFKIAFATKSASVSKLFDQLAPFSRHSLRSIFKGLKLMY